MSKPILCLDFDGVIHSYSSGWQGADVIPDPPVAGAMEFLDRARAKFRLAIYSSRSCQPNGILAMRLWLQLQLGRYCGREEALAEEIFAAIEWPVEKPAAFLSIDDRAIQFNGKWPDLDSMLNFLPWNKVPPYVPSGNIPGTNSGHGHVWQRPDGMMARCGGRGLCQACREDEATLAASDFRKHGDDALSHLSNALDDLDSSPDQRAAPQLREAMHCVRAMLAAGPKSIPHG